VRPLFRSFGENSRSYLTKRIGKTGRSPTGAVDQSQVRSILGGRSRVLVMQACQIRVKLDEDKFEHAR